MWYKELRWDLRVVPSANLQAAHREVHYEESEVQFRGAKANVGAEYRKRGQGHKVKVSLPSQGCLGLIQILGKRGDLTYPMC